MNELGGERGERGGCGSEMPAVAALYYTITVRKDYKYHVGYSLHKRERFFLLIKSPFPNLFYFIF